MTQPRVWSSWGYGFAPRKDTKAMTDMEAKAREWGDSRHVKPEQLYEWILEFGKEAHNAGMEEAAKVVEAGSSTRWETTSDLLEDIAAAIREKIKDA